VRLPPAIPRNPETLAISSSFILQSIKKPTQIAHVDFVGIQTPTARFFNTVQGCIPEIYRRSLRLL
jgi:hypothetical protein